jgi:tryptophan synthase alpha chain
MQDSSDFKILLWTAQALDMSRIDNKFQDLRATNRKAFIPFITAGDPDLKTSIDLILTLDRAGADIIEVGVPFSDPIADGPVIQRATERALAAHTTLRDILQLGKEVRKTSQVPLLIMSYYNPLIRYGLDKLARDAAEAGFDGILASDLTVEESGPFVAAMNKAGLNTVFLVAPTSSPERIRKIAQTSSGFLYAVSRTGITGEQQELSTELRDFLKTLRCHTPIPIAVGFGISRPEHVQAVWQEADGAVVGSALVRAIEEHSRNGNLTDKIAEFARWLKGVAA